MKDLATTVRFGEIIYTLKLPNGLTVNLLARPQYHKTYGVLTTNYGSVDTTFILEGQNEPVTYPAGIAHFLEHKMFDKEDYDAFDLFGKYGADSNAFTSYTRTSYMFSTTENAQSCVTTLLDFVQTPYFTDEKVNKEKGIIDQEIKMYEDNPNWGLFSGIVKNMYPQTPLALDIAGTSQSIQEIKAQDLTECYAHFYRPENMNLFLVGNFIVDDMISLIEENQAQKEFPPLTSPQYQFDYTKTDLLPYRMEERDIQQPKTIIGIKGLDQVPAGRAGLFYYFKIEILMQLLYSESTPQYLAMYNQGVIDDSFDYDFLLERGFHFATIYGNTKHPQAFVKQVIQIAENAVETIQNQTEAFELAKKELVGRLITSLDSLESIANNYEGELFAGATLFDVIPLIEKMELNEVVEVAQQFIKEEAISVYQIFPKEDDIQ